MKNFKRRNLLFSLCGLNCGLCPMYSGNYCPGCGGGEGNQSCAIAKCSIEHNKIEYCSQCSCFPCEKYKDIDSYDSFITHRNRMKDFERIKELGIDKYNAEQKEKIDILKFLLENYNDGRKKTFFCLSVNLLDLQDLKNIMNQIKDNEEINKLTLKEKSNYITRLFRDVALKKNIKLKLYKKST